MSMASMGLCVVTKSGSRNSDSDKALNQFGFSAIGVSIFFAHCAVYVHLGIPIFGHCAILRKALPRCIAAIIKSPLVSARKEHCD